MKDSILLDLFRVLPEFGGHQRICFEYAEKWGVGPPFNVRKLFRILSETLEMLKRGEFSFQKRVYRISREGIVEGLRTVCNQQLKGHLTSHNYLKKILTGIAEEEARERSREDERKLRDSERGLREGRRPADRVEGRAAMPQFFKEFMRDFGSEDKAGAAEKGAGDGSHAHAEAPGDLR